jgi:YHS domain-containing protein/thiol-disulfide isomerase/thioredoxin
MQFATGRARAGLIIAALALPLAVYAAELRSEAWREDFETAEAEAKQLGLPLLVHFHAQWCGPCKEMERTVLRDPVLLQTLRSQFVAVQVDSDQRPDLVQRFHIEKLPTDVFVDPRGYVLERSSGSKSRERYFSLVARIDAICTQTRSMRIASQTKTLAPQTQRVIERPLMSQEPSPPPMAPEPVGPHLNEPMPIATSIGAKPGFDTHPRSSERRYSSLGMKGYSPVALSMSRQWVRGNQHYSVEYRGIVYFMTTAQEQTQFRDKPDRYAPQILGCDPVILDIADRAVPGDIRYAAFFDGELYLFVSERSRQLFKQDPRRFIRARHALQVDDLDEKRLE